MAAPEPGAVARALTDLVDAMAALRHRKLFHGLYEWEQQEIDGRIQAGRAALATPPAVEGDHAMARSAARLASQNCLHAESISRPCEACVMHVFFAGQAVERHLAAPDAAQIEATRPDISRQSAMTRYGHCRRNPALPSPPPTGRTGAEMACYCGHSPEDHAPECTGVYEVVGVVELIPCTCIAYEADPDT